MARLSDGFHIIGQDKTKNKKSVVVRIGIVVRVRSMLDAMDDPYLLLFAP